MKKIISALTLGAMVAGAAFADVGVTLNYRQRATLLSHVNKASNIGVDTKKNSYGVKGSTDEASKIFFTDAYSGSGTDNLGINIGGDIASFAITLVGDESKDTYIRAKTLGADLQVGKVGLFAGFWSDGKVKGAYRNKADVDAGNMEGMDFEFKKLGSAYAGSPSFFVDNIVMPVNVTASESYAIGAKYNIRNFKACKLEVNGVYIANETSEDNQKPKSSGSLQGHSLVGLVEANTNYGSGEFVFKYGQSAYQNSDKKYADAMAFGAYLQPKIMNNLTATIGGAGSVVDGDFTDWSADLRLYYKTGALSFTSFHSYSALVDAKESIGKLNGKKNASTKGIADGFSYDSSKTSVASYAAGGHKGTILLRDAILTNNLMVRYKVNSKFAVYGVVADMIGLGENGGNDLTDKDGKPTTDALIQLRASAWAQFYAGGNSISVGVVYENYDVAETYGDSVQSIAIPMIFRVKM